MQNQLIHSRNVLPPPLQSQPSITAVPPPHFSSLPPSPVATSSHLCMNSKFSPSSFEKWTEHLLLFSSITPLVHGGIFSTTAQKWFHTQSAGL
jgi:hypothetical protein